MSSAAPGPRVPSHVILIGLPGSGKTSVGRALAAQVGCSFVDFDEEIERREGGSVSRIFAERGEPHFRALERGLTEEMRTADREMVLAPGGGWVTIPGVLQILRPPGAVIYLAARPETALRRMGPLRDRRPLLADPDPLAALKRLAAQRVPLYESAADLVIDTEPIGIQGVVRGIIERISLFRGNPIMPPG